MKSRLLTIFGIFITAALFAQPANDNCTGAIPITLNTPTACAGTTGGTANFTTVAGTTVGATAENPYYYQTNCLPSAGSMPAPAADVWYSFVATGATITIQITGLTTPNIALWTGACTALQPQGCAVGAAGVLNATFNYILTVGTTYYIQVAGGSATDQGTFTMNVKNTTNCANCLLAANIVATPAPVNGQYAAGQTVQFCFTVTNWNSNAVNWLHGVTPTFGSGWNTATLAPVLPAPAACTGSGWGWYATETSSTSGIAYGPGFFIDLDGDGNPGDNYGDAGAGVGCNITFCWKITVKAGCNPSDSDLAMRVKTWGDGQSGSWGISNADKQACANDSAIWFQAKLALPKVATTSINGSCTGGTTGTATAVILGGTAPYTYSWAPGGQTTATATNLAAGTYTLTLTDASGCTSTAIAIINQSAPVVIITPSSVSVCPGSSTSLSASGATTYSWSDGETTNPISVTPATNTTYTVTGTSGTCTATATATVTVSSTLVLTANASPTSICVGSSSILTATGPTGTTYSWSPVISTTNPTTVNPLTTTTYTVTGTNGACTGTATVTVTANPVPTVTITGNDSICQGSNTILSANGATSYIWTPSTGLSSSTVANPTANPSTNTTYTVTGTDGNGCTNTATAAVIVNPIPSAPTAASPIMYCQGSTINPLSAAGSAGATLTWYKDSSSVVLGTGNTFTPSPLPTVTTSYWVAQTSQYGCQGPSTEVTIIINPKPVIDTLNAIISGPLCKGTVGNITNITVSGGTAPYTYVWTNSSGVVSTSTTTTNINNLGAGTYTLTVSSAGGCTAQTSPYILTNSSVTASFTANPDSGIAPLQVNFTNTSTGANSYEWNLGNGDTTNAVNPSTKYANTGTYNVELIATNSDGCKDTAYETIDVYGQSILIVPNVFSPNGDGKNDVFMVKASGIATFEGQVFDRWGIKMFDWDEVNGGWNGKTAAGKDAPDGTYYYLINATGTDGKKYVEKGFLTLLR